MREVVEGKPTSLIGTADSPAVRIDNKNMVLERQSIAIETSRVLNKARLRLRRICSSLDLDVEPFGRGFN
jgi:hypothetical protein